MTNIKEKILAVQFQYLGDVIFLLPALKALRLKFPKAELHVLVASEMKPLLDHVNFIDKIWTAYRIRGKVNLLAQIPVLFLLRKEHFSRAVDFGGNDRGAIFTLLSGARIRLGMINKPNNILHKFCYTQKINASNLSNVYIQKNLDLLGLWDVDTSFKPIPKIDLDKSYLFEAKKIFNESDILCHIGTSQPKKEWPIFRWLELNKLLNEAGYNVIYTSGTNLRERLLLDQLKKENKSIRTLDPVKDLNLFLAILSLARIVISGDTGPLHFARALGVKVLGLYAAEGSVVHAAPNYQFKEKVLGKKCTCIGSLQHYETCQSPFSCMDSIQAKTVFKKVQILLS